MCIQVEHLYSKNPNSQMFQNLQIFQHQFDATNEKFHTVQLFFMHKIMKNAQNYLWDMCIDTNEFYIYT